MVIGAMHIHIAILLFAFERWFLHHDLLGHSCMVKFSSVRFESIDVFFSLSLLVTNFSFLGRFLFDVRLDVSQNFACLSNIHLEGSTVTPIESEKSPLGSASTGRLSFVQLLQDHYLLLICGYLYALDVICAFLWQIFDPHRIVLAIGSVRKTVLPSTKEFLRLQIQRLNVDTIVINQLYYCHSEYRQKLLGLLYFYKSLFLVVGGYLAAKTRHVHISALNDSKFIVWSIYTVVLTSLFTVIVMNSLQNLRTHIAISLIVLLMTSFILCLIFLPKVLKLKHRQREEVLSKDLYMDQSRTRRLAVEISYFESHRYAQLQNRELKAEIVRVRNQQGRIGD